MHIFTKNVSHSGTNLAVLIAKDCLQLWKVLSNMLALLEAGQLRPITLIHRYSLGDIDAGLRFLQSGKSTGKIVIYIDSTASVPVSLFIKNCNPKSFAEPKQIAQGVHSNY